MVCTRFRKPLCHLHFSLLLNFNIFALKVLCVVKFQSVFVHNCWVNVILNVILSTRVYFYIIGCSLRKWNTDMWHNPHILTFQTGFVATILGVFHGFRPWSCFRIFKWLCMHFRSFCQWKSTCPFEISESMYPWTSLKTWCRITVVIASLMPEQGIKDAVAS